MSASCPSGLTYWRLDESELYRPLPDSFDSGAYLLLQEASISLVGEGQKDNPNLFHLKYSVCFHCAENVSLFLGKSHTFSDLNPK